MNLRLIPFQAVGLASVSLFGPDEACPSYVRVVDLGVGLLVRRLALGPGDDTISRPTAISAGGGPGTEPLDAARLDILIARVEQGGDAGPHECGGA